MWSYGCKGPRRAWRRHDARAFGPWGWAGSSGFAGRFFGPGEARLALLSLLSAGPRHGYDLMRELERRSGGVYRASAGTVYPTLQQLEDEGLVASETVEGRRVYRLTDRGHAELEEEAATVRRIWRRAEEWGDWSFAFEPDAAEVARPALRLLKVALRSLARDPSARRIERIREILERALREIEDLPQG